LVASSSRKPKPEISYPKYREVKWPFKNNIHKRIELVIKWKNGKLKKGYIFGTHTQTKSECLIWYPKYLVKETINKEA